MLIALPNDPLDIAFEATLVDAYLRQHDPRCGDMGRGAFHQSRALLTMILQSSNRIVVNGVQTQLMAGDAMLIAPGTTMQAHFAHDGILRVLNLRVHILSDHRQNLHAVLPAVVRAAQDTDALRQAMEACVAAHSEGVKTLADLALGQCLIELARLRICADRAQYPRPVKLALQYLREHRDQPMDRNTLALYANVSPGHLSHLIRRYTGSTITAHINRTRIAYAKQLMHETTLNFSQIAHQLNMDLYAFSRLFKKVAGTSPTTYCQATDIYQLRTK